ncbi:MAG: bifunctional adenosylcobinamide kinase/adenosylcobinamide-phosphate guanylyltransferase [Colwellia sp.]
MIHFVLGGARSGKSRFAEQQALKLSVKQSQQAVYIATATAIDAEMDNRIVQHQNDRGTQGDSWQLIECPLALSETLTDLDNNNVYLLDCLTLWLNNQLYAVHEESRAQQGQHLQTEIDILTARLAAINADIIIVSNEIGLGVVPMGESTRLYVDYCGWLNQKVAEVSDKVTLVTAGIPLCIKSNDE